MLKRRLAWALLLAGATAAGAADFADGVRARFVASGPAIALAYRVSYRVMGIELVHVADAKVEVALGEWRSADGTRVPAGALDFSLDTLEGREEDRERKIHVAVHNRVLAILRRPELEAIVFAKRTDQRLRFLWRRQRKDTTEIYDLESGGLRYEGIDHLAGTSTTNLAGRRELAGEGKRVCSLMKAAYETYVQQGPGGRGVANQEPIHLYIQGDLVPYGLRVKDRNARLRMFGRSLPSLRLWAYPLKRTSGRACGCEAWILPFGDLAERIDPEMRSAFGGDVEEWIMVPLLADLDLSLGTMRGRLEEAGVRPSGGP